MVEGEACGAWTPGTSEDLLRVAAPCAVCGLGRLVHPGAQIGIVRRG